VAATDVLKKLKMCIDSRVKLFFWDGEVVICDLAFVVESENVIVFDLISSNRPDKYERLDNRPHISAAISEVTECELVNEPRAH
jgi:hypothetical protein